MLRLGAGLEHQGRAGDREVIKAPWGDDVGWASSLGAACVFFTLCACGKERPDPRLAELTTPVHVTVGHRRAGGRTCAGSLTEQATCLFSRAERHGCVYVEGGSRRRHPRGEQDA